MCSPAGCIYPPASCWATLANKTNWADSLCCTESTTPNGFSNPRDGAGSLTTYLLEPAHPEKTQPDGWPLTSLLCMATSQTATWVSPASLPSGKNPAYILLPTRVRNTTPPQMGDPEVTRGLKTSISYLDLQPRNHSLGGKGK